jgi:uncharacterized membrane protein
MRRALCGACEGRATATIRPVRSPHRRGADEPWIERGTNVERTVFFSDAVFAIAITLLALEIRVPDDPRDLGEALLELWPRFISFFISFWFVGTYWVAHHRAFRYVSGYDRRLLFINLLFLMWIVLIPFSSSLLGEHGDYQVVVIIYATHIALTGLTLQWVWRYAWRDERLMDASRMDERERRYNELGLSVPLVFLVSIGVSFVSVTAAELFWFLAFLVRPVLHRIL